MGFTGAPDPGIVREARRRFLAGAGLDAAAAVSVRQVHGAAVLVAEPGDRGRGGLDPSRSLGDADGIVTKELSTPLLVLSADCAVVALADGAGRAVGVFHSGWRGVLARVPAAAVAAVGGLAGTGSASLRAVFGPAVGPCCYEVGTEVSTPFLADFGCRSGEWFRPGRGERPHFDLPGAVRASLVDAGLLPESVSGPGPCTLCGGDLFSHRGGDSGRQMLVAARI